jgi:hypothetical protein
MQTWLFAGDEAAMKITTAPTGMHVTDQVLRRRWTVIAVLNSLVTISSSLLSDGDLHLGLLPRFYHTAASLFLSQWQQ